MSDQTVNVSVTEDAQIDVTIVETETIAVAITTIDGVILSFNTEILPTTGSQKSFTFEQTFLPGSLLIFRNGILATDEITEKVDRSGVDFTDAPAADDVYEVRYAYV